jgi:hypothetical protein
MKNKLALILALMLYFAVTSFAQNFLNQSIRNESVDSLSDSKRIAWKPFDPATIGVQTLTGAGAVGAVALILYPREGLHGGRAGLGQLGAAVAGAIGALVFPTAFYFGGVWMGGNGSYAWTLLGSLGAGGIALLPNIIEGTGDIDAAIVRTVIATVGGAILGYHLSASAYESDGELSFTLPLNLKIGRGLDSRVPRTPREDFRFLTISIQL